MVETWRSIIGCEGRYEVSDLGRIRTVERVNVMHYKAGHTQTRKIAAKIRSLTWVGDRTKYLGCLVIDNAGRTRFVKAHVEVLRAFVGERPGPEWDACHNDSDPSNNALFNLRWDTKTGNNADKFRAGTAQVGERNPAAKLTDAQVRALRAQKHKTLKELAREYGISIAAVSKIRRGEKYKHIKELIE